MKKFKFTLAALAVATLLLLATAIQSRAETAQSRTTLSMSCPMKLSFKTPSEQQKWGAVNDGVMGGRSSGGPSFNDAHMVFSGVINTNGGGFSSVRRFVEPGVLGGADGINLRVKSDGRGYKLSLRTDAYFRRRSIAFQAPIAATQPGEWETVFVPFDDLQASIFGRPLRGATFDPSKVNTIGIILSDGQDGPFELKVDWMEGCGKTA
ncbi:CIA30 family protein [Fretibacter rubidus]|uniref:CIA30 family protein n=1 Tax=Fretibacter rubidus TaxID=570162 RepID=UPI00352B839A